MLTETERNDLIAKVEAANLVSPEQVCDFVLTAGSYEAGLAELAKASEFDLSEIISVLASQGAMFDGGSDTSRREIAEEWHDHDFSADEVRDWTNAGCWEVSTASALQAAGFRPGTDELAYRPGEEIGGMDAMYAFCNSDVGQFVSPLIHHTSILLVSCLTDAAGRDSGDLVTGNRILALEKLLNHTAMEQIVAWQREDQSVN